MVMLRTKCVIVIQVIYFLVISRAGEPVGVPTQERYRALLELPTEMPIKMQCPDPEDIKPCECSVNEDNSMDMDCSNIKNDEELKTVFSKEFPFTNFSNLMISNNENLQALRSGDLGKSSFVKIYILNSSLDEIEDHALMESYDTLEYLELWQNNLESVPDITLFKRLTTLYVQENALTEFPILDSLTLEQLDLTFNQIQTVPIEATNKLPSLNGVYLTGNSISNVSSGAFANHTNLKTVDLSYNNLTTLPQAAIELHDPNSYLYLYKNNITYLPPGSFSGVTKIMGMAENSLRELDEEVWRPLLEDQVALLLGENPFVCGCDVAWLILNRTLLDRMADMPTCVFGVTFADLDPAIYEALC